MNVKKFSDAMSELDSKYIDEALNYKKKAKKPVWVKWGAMAACLCIVLALGVLIKSPTSGEIVGPGFLAITAYAASSDEEMIMQEGIELPLDYNWSLAISSRPGLPLKLSADEYPNVTFEVSVDNGKLLLWENNKISAMSSPFEVENGTTIYWTNIYQADEKYMGTTAYINIIIRDGKNIVGYAVVNIYTNDLENAPAQSYYAKLLKSVSFPQVNGEYQKITVEYVAAEMEQIKSETQAGQTVPSMLTPQESDGGAGGTIADAPPMVYVNDTLYKQSTKQTSYNELKDDFVYLGVIESDITNLQNNSSGNASDGIPKENFQANHPIVGAKVYQYGDDIVVEIEGKYWLYETINDNTLDEQSELSEEEKMQLDPFYGAGIDGNPD